VSVVASRPGEQALGERIDQLISLDAPARGVIAQLYRWARDDAPGPLAMTAARLLAERVDRESVVFIATGWPDRPHITPEIAETDGPPGAAALALALHRGLGAVPVVLVEPSLVRATAQVVEATGLRVLTPHQAKAAARSAAPIHAAAVLPFPTDREEAKVEAVRLLDSFVPAACVAIEKGGMNEKGFVHTSRGDETSEHMSKVDYLFQEAARRHVATIGIGDGGNEIGMARIREKIAQNVPYGAAGKDPAKGGIAPSTMTDVLIAASISNWGAYGLAAGIAYLRGDIGILHDADVEARLHAAGARASFIDGITGYVEPGADGLAAPIHQAFVTLLRETVRQALLKEKPPIQGDER